ncbi:translocation/assembly module TamB domain-containing protein [Parafilimonas sp.]|uniref:translocation/assembly module TamB domain-containing protein n=1 Tax=Parafilimonas sp. TaxID=1969739 RepID=UPI0039E2F57E
MAAVAWMYIWPNLLLLLVACVLIASLLLWPKAFLRFIIGFFALLLLAWLLIQLSPVQNFIAGKVTSKLSAALKTTVKIGEVNFSLFDKMNLSNTLILDQHKDTLLKAGSLKLRITDWFFFKKQIELKYIGLEDAAINQQRNDSVWNYQFLIDYFSPPKARRQSNSIMLKIQKLDLKNVVYTKNDLWRGQKTVLKTGSLLVDADNINLSKNLILINSIDMDKTSYNIENFNGIDTTQKKITKRDTARMYFNPGNLRIRVTALNIKDGFFGTGWRNETPREGVFYGRKLMVSRINGTIKNLSLLKDTITANIDIDAAERSGVHIRKLQAQYKLTPQKMEFSKLLLKTNKSTVTNYFVMKYKDFKKDMADYTNKVVMAASIKNSLVYSDDIAYFAPVLAKWNERFVLNGNFNGTVNDFTVKSLFAKNGNNTYISGDLAVTNTTDPVKINITLNDANVQTNNREIAFVLPDLATITSPNLAALGNVRFVGNFTGTLNDFKAKGTLASALGGLYTDVSFSFPKKAEPSYKGIIQTRQFNLGRFLSVANLGNVTFNGNISGRSFKLSKISTKLNGNFASLVFKDYDYKNLSFDGEIKQRNFQGEFIAADTNFNFTSNIAIDLNGEAPSFNILGDLANANLRALHLSEDSIVVAGLLDMDFQGHNIDDFLGFAKILNASVKRNSQQLYLDSITLSTSLDSNNVKVLRLESRELSASVEGQYKILQLPQNFQAFLNRYYPSYINPPKNELGNQNFKISVRTGDFENYAKIIDSNFSGFDDALLTGRISNVNGRHINFNINIPFAKYKNLSLEDAKFTGDGDEDSLLLTGNLGRFYVSDSTFFPNTKISVRSANDLSHVLVSTSANTTLNYAELDADVRTLPEGVSINFHPSSFVLNNKKWNLQNQGEVMIKKNASSAKNMKFTQGFQEISIESVPDETGASNALAVKLKDVDIGDIMPLFVKNPLMEGVANGNVYFRNIYTKLTADGQIHLTQFRLNNDSIGLIDLSTKYNADVGKIIFSIKSNSETFVLNSDGQYDLRDSTNKPLATTMHLDHAKVGILNSFLGTIFDDITGLATGTIHLNGSFKDLHLTGKAHLDSGALTVRYTQVRYFIPSADFVFYDDRLDFGSFTIKDKFGNTGKVSGVLNETAFKNNSYAFNMSTDKLLLLDTKAKDNPLFYGDVTGKANVSLNGPQENMQMSISGEPTDASHVYIQTNTSKKSADADFIIFKQYGGQPKTDSAAAITNLNINLDLTANNKVTLSVILDELTGDIIEATGNGRMLIKVPAIGDVSMTGRYNIEQGNYNFNFQSLVKKPFELIPDQNSYIEWNGNPYNALINITARYTAKNVSVSDLVSSSGFLLDQSISGYRGDVYVIAGLVGKLTQPQIKFRLDFPEGSAIRSNDNFNRLLAKMESDENEMLKQVTWLIVFDSFSPYGEISSSQTFVQSTAYNTISQKIASVLNSKISDLLYSLTGDRTLHFDVGAKTYSSYSISGTSSSSNTLDRTAVELKLNKSLLNNKLIITFGGDLDFNVSSTAAASATNNNLQWLPDISVQIVLSKDRKLRAIVFNHSSLGATNTGTIGRVTRQGVSISYTRDFDRLFGKDFDESYFITPPATDTTQQRQKRRK